MLFVLLPRQDSNLNRLIQNQLCYRITPRGIVETWSARRDLNPLSRKGSWVTASRDTPSSPRAGGLPDLDSNQE